MQSANKSSEDLTCQATFPESPLRHQKVDGGAHPRVVCESGEDHLHGSFK